MDIQRSGVKRKRVIRRVIAGVIAVGAVLGITLGLSRLKPAAPSVEQNTVYLGKVERGQMLRRVRGPGRLIPSIVWWIPAETAGRVERVLVEPGIAVQPDTVLLHLSNPELDLSAHSAQWELKSAEAELTSLRVRLKNESLELEAAVARVEADFSEAKLRKEVNDELFREGLISERNLRLSQVRVEELEKLTAINQRRLAIRRESHEAQLAVQHAQVERARAEYQLRQEQVAALRVRAGTGGVLEQLSVEVGQRVMPAATLAKVTDPTSLKARLQIPETQARDVQIGLPATIDTRNGIISGRVMRIDPAVQNGSVTVDVSLEGPLPKGARPDLTVDGTVEIERLEDVLYVGRPVFGQAHSTVGLFRIDPQTGEAVRVQVQLGRSSVNTIEVVAGLDVGDQVILSDVSQWDAYDRIRLR